MSRRARRCLPALVVLAAVAIADATRPALTRPAAADRPTPLPRLRRLRAINRRLTDRIARVNPPIGTDRSHDSAINIGLRTDRELGRLTLALKRSPDPAAELARRRPALATAATSDAHRWAQLRLKGCV